MAGFEKIVDGIYRLKIPFDTVYTSVFLLCEHGEYMLVDSGAEERDVDEYILPSLQAFGVDGRDLKYLVISHCHGDHSGGAAALMRRFPQMERVLDERSLSENFSTRPLAGHTEDCIGVFEKRSGSLITADGVQGYGVDKFRCTVQNVEKYVETLEKIRLDDAVKNLIFSHAYEPWNADCAFGVEEKEKCLQASLSYMQEK